MRYNSKVTQIDPGSAGNTVIRGLTTKGSGYDRLYQKRQWQQKGQPT